MAPFFAKAEKRESITSRPESSCAVAPSGLRRAGPARDRAGVAGTPDGGAADPTAAGDGGRPALAGERGEVSGNRGWETLFHPWALLQSVARVTLSEARGLVVDLVPTPCSSGGRAALELTFQDVSEVSLVARGSWARRFEHFCVTAVTPTSGRSLWPGPRAGLPVGLSPYTERPAPAPVCGVGAGMYLSQQLVLVPLRSPLGTERKW